VLWCNVSVEAARRQRIITEVIALHETIDSNSAHLSAVLSSCRLPQNLHPSVISSVDVMRRIVAKSTNVVNRATCSDATANDVALILELASQSRKIIDSAMVHVGTDTCIYACCLSVCLSVCLCLTDTRCLQKHKGKEECR